MRGQSEAERLDGAVANFTIDLAGPLADAHIQRTVVRLLLPTYPR
jgi:hypothetical protein